MWKKRLRGHNRHQRHSTEKTPRSTAQLVWCRVFFGRSPGTVIGMANPDRARRVPPALALRTWTSDCAHRVTNEGASAVLCASARRENIPIRARKLLKTRGSIPGSNSDSINTRCYPRRRAMTDVMPMQRTQAKMMTISLSRITCRSARQRRRRAAQARCTMTDDLASVAHSKPAPAATTLR